MIVPISGKVKYSITMDPTVWIFDDRKIELQNAFNDSNEEVPQDDDLTKAAKRWDKEVSRQHKPPVNKSITQFEGKKVLTKSYVMPIADFIGHAEIKSDARNAILITDDGDKSISLESLRDAYLLFALEGKPLKEDGPVHLLYGDGSNKEAPIKSVKKIVID